MVAILKSNTIVSQNFPPGKNYYSPYIFLDWLVKAAEYRQFNVNKNIIRGFLIVGYMLKSFG
jgi:hypothetical protein